MDLKCNAGTRMDIGQNLIVYEKFRIEENLINMGFFDDY